MANTALITICITLIIIILILIWYGLRVHKLYLKANSEQIKSMVSDYSKIATDSNALLDKCNKTMIDLINHTKIIQ